MNFSFHYYGTYCAAREAGFDSDDAWVIAHSAQFVDECSRELLSAHKKVNTCPTYHTAWELSKMNIGWLDSPFPNEIPQVWTSFHFLPGNLDENKKYILYYRNDNYITNSKEMELFKLMCLPYSYMSGQIVDAAKREYSSCSCSNNKKLSYIGIVMHVLADTFAHEYFVGTPSEAINETPWITEYNEEYKVDPYKLSNIRVTRKKYYKYSPAFSSTSVGWLGHGRIGSNPDIPNKKYYYKPNWDPEAECMKNNPLIHLCAFFQMKKAMEFIRDANDTDPFDYKTELSAEEYNSDLGLALIDLFDSEGDDKNQNVEWINHILKVYGQSVNKHDTEMLANDQDFLDDFTNNAAKHMKLVCDYCDEVTSDEITYFSI